MRAVVLLWLLIALCCASWRVVVQNADAFFRGADVVNVVYVMDFHRCSARYHDLDGLYLLGARMGLFRLAVVNRQRFFDALYADCSRVCFSSSCPDTQPVTCCAVFGGRMRLEHSVSPLQRCDGRVDRSISLNVSGGVEPLSFVWYDSSGTQVATTKDLQRVASSRGPYSVRVTDVLGFRAHERVFVRPVVMVATHSTPASSEAATDGALEAIVPSTSHAAPPFKYYWSRIGAQTARVEGLAVGIYHVTVTDSNGCEGGAVAAVVVASPLQVSIEVVKNATGRHLWDGEIKLRISGGRAPYTIEWTNLGGHDAHAIDVAAGVYRAFVADSMGVRVVSEEAVVGVENAPFPLFPQLEECAQLRTLPVPYFVNCLKKVAAPLIWGSRSQRWPSCDGAWALVGLADVFRNHSERGDFGDSFVGLILGDAVDGCLKRKSESDSGEECCGFTMERVGRLFRASNQTLYKLFKKAKDWETFRAHAVPYIAFGDTPFGRDKRPVALTVGPFGFDNEPLFAPSLVFPTKNFRVVSLVLKAFSFPSSSVRLSFFPWTLQLDVDVAAAYVLRLIKYINASYVFPGDSGGVLVLAKLGSKLIVWENDRETATSRKGVVDALQRSGPWPPEYPPPHLSKLIRGHEAFSPKEVVISEDDGCRSIQVDLSAAHNAWKELNFSAYVKREFSEASRGVAKVLATSGNALSDAIQSVFWRGPGVAVMDLDLRVKIFMQQAVPLASGVRPVAFRFYAIRGRVLAAHVSMVAAGNANYGVVHETIRNDKVEEAASLFVRAINYTGFGALWFWEGMDGRPYLVDFNARLERHACLTALLGFNEADLVCDPCYAFQTTADLDDETLRTGISMRVMRAGIRFLEPVRLLGGGGSEGLMRLVRDSGIPWNLHKQDSLLYDAVLQKVQAWKPPSDAVVKSVPSGKETPIVRALKEIAARRKYLLVSGHSGGWSPLHAACKRGDLPMVVALVKADEEGILMDLTDADGNTAQDVAQKNGFKNIAALLQALRMGGKLENIQE